MTKQWENRPDSLYNPVDFWICPICQFHFNKRTFTVETLEKHVEECSKKLAEDVVQLQLELHPEVSEDFDEEC